MNSETEALKTVTVTSLTRGNGSIAHQIIGEFIAILERSEGYEAIAKNIEETIFTGKPTETALRKAMFGDEPL